MLLCEDEIEASQGARLHIAHSQNVVAISYGALRYFENTGSATAPAFTPAAPNPFSTVDVGQYSTPSFADLDGDGDLDAVVGGGDGNLNYFRNTTPPAIAPDFAEQTGAANPFNGFDVSSRSAPSFADLDSDGDLDAIVGEDDGNLNYFENTGSAVAPAFAAAVVDPSGLADVGFSSAPSFADLDGDGDLDVIVGEDDGNLNYFENTGSAIAPAFIAQTGVANPFNGFDVGFASTPSFADLDGDGDLDAVVGEQIFGTLNYFENTGSATAPAFTARTGTANPFSGVDVGYSSAPSFADLDGDGDLDAIVGEFCRHPELFQEHRRRLRADDRRDGGERGAGARQCHRRPDLARQRLSGSSRYRPIPSRRWAAAAR